MSVTPDSAEEVLANKLHVQGLLPILSCGGFIPQSGAGISVTGEDGAIGQFVAPAEKWGWDEAVRLTRKDPRPAQTRDPSFGNSTCEVDIIP